MIVGTTLVIHEPVHRKPKGPEQAVVVVETPSFSAE